MSNHLKYHLLFCFIKSAFWAEKGEPVARHVSVVFDQGLSLNSNKKTSLITSQPLKLKAMNYAKMVGSYLILNYLEKSIKHVSKVDLSHHESNAR